MQNVTKCNNVKGEVWPCVTSHSFFGFCKARTKFVRALRSICRALHFVHAPRNYHPPKCSLNRVKTLIFSRGVCYGVTILFWQDDQEIVTKFAKDLQVKMA